MIVGEGALFYYFTVWQHVWFLYHGGQDANLFCWDITEDFWPTGLSYVALQLHYNYWISLQSILTAPIIRTLKAISAKWHVGNPVSTIKVYCDSLP